MTPRPGDHVRHSLGAFALGHLGDDEMSAVRAHLDGCPECREEAADLASVARLLPLADPERVGAPAEAPQEMLDVVLSRIEQERGSRDRTRRRSILARVGAAAAVVVVVLTVAMFSLLPSEPSGEIVAMSTRRPGVLGEAVIHEDPRSTWVELTTSGLSVGETYAVWFEEIDSGKREGIGTFIGVEGDLYISLYSPMPRDRVASIGVSTPDGDVVMQGAVPAPVPS
ncbi:MAG: anti-sigma factor family protein [Actinomycetota bacterium]